MTAGFGAHRAPLQPTDPPPKRNLPPRLADAPHSCFTAGMALPYKIATLLYCFNEQDEVLLLERAQEPNRGLWSPPGGKLHTETGESPYACACREAAAEVALKLRAGELQLTGLISVHGSAGQANWLMFHFEVRTKLRRLPDPHREGRFAFFAPAALAKLALPQTDREQIWPLFWRHRDGFFAAHCHCQPDGHNTWTVEASRPTTR